ncbi:MAG: hypothetical protein HKN50_08440 [Gammaproteobacteria bacterium]|nr:hypothetical protein [Gammaproteobacteria bacterium]
METWIAVIGFLAYGSVALGLVSAYLQLNKIWKRKHREEVANSISIVGHVMTIIPGTIFALNFLVVSQWQGFLNSVIWISWGCMMILIGSGLWVQGRRKVGLWRNIKRALKLEQDEFGDLALAMFRPASADLVLQILTRFAWIDDQLDEREKDYIKGFADSWNLKIDWHELHGKSDHGSLHSNLIETHRLVNDYLLTSPPEPQVRELADVLQNLVEIDEQITEQEEVILEETLAMLSGYGSDDGAQENFSVVIAPRNDDQTAALKALLPDSDEVAVAGGWGYMVGNYCSEKYANKMCERYRSLGFFTVSMMMDADLAT